MINHLHEKEDKSGNTISVIHADKLSMTPAYSLFLNSYAELVDKEFISPTTSWRDDTTEIVWAEHNGKVIGFLTFLNHPVITNAGILFTFYVIPKYRNCGVFRILLTDFENILKERNFEFYGVTIGHEDENNYSIMKRFGLKTLFYSIQKNLV